MPFRCRCFEILDIPFDNGQDTVHSILPIDPVKLPYVEIDVFCALSNGKLNDQKTAADHVGILIIIPRISPSDVVVQVLICFRCGALVIETDILLCQGQLVVFAVCLGGDKRDRTADLLNAIQALSQLSYTPIADFYI